MAVLRRLSRKWAFRMRCHWWFRNEGRPVQIKIGMVHLLNQQTGTYKLK